MRKDKKKKRRRGAGSDANLTRSATMYDFPSLLPPSSSLSHNNLGKWKIYIVEKIF
jgi:hypothetical protein